MKFKLIIWATAFCVISGTVLAQSQSEESQALERRYDYAVSKLGYAGVGVETILNEWETVDPTNEKMMLGRYNYYLTKSQRSEVVTKTSKKYLGMNPLLSLKDSTGTEVYYYQETFYDDSLFTLAIQALDRVIAGAPDRIDLRFSKAAALVSYEKDSPDMALSYLYAIIDMDGKGRRAWVYPEQEMSPELFREVIQEYCHTFYLIGSYSSYEAFRGLSEKMVGLYPKDAIFLSNLGTYYFVVARDNKTALKYYNKALKANPSYYPAISNCVLMARRSSDVKAEKKYLRLMVEHGPQNEAMLAQARLEALESK